MVQPIGQGGRLYLPPRHPIMYTLTGKGIFIDVIRLANGIRESPDHGNLSAEKILRGCSSFRSKKKCEIGGRCAVILSIKLPKEKRLLIKRKVTVEAPIPKPGRSKPW
ncbi:hypothetical protein WJR50_30155 [Catalinimonas sp. 4WD22]|uniref:hypothetical protein n=1 Tax=Catalinimonas locisalis TaxID=3133978 RepID=UPI003101681F